MQFNDFDEKNWVQNYAFFSLHVLYGLRLPDLYFWFLKMCVLYSNFYGKHIVQYLSAILHLLLQVSLLVAIVKHILGNWSLLGHRRRGIMNTDAVSPIKH